MKAHLSFKKHRLLFGILILIVVVIVAFSIKPKTGGALLSAGGPVSSITLCTCTPGVPFYVILGPPKGGAYLVTALTKPYAYYDIWGTGGTWYRETYVPAPVGPWNLSGYVPGGACAIVTSPTTPCYFFPTAVGTITAFGSSLGPASI